MAGPTRSTEREGQVLKTENRWPGLGLGLLFLTSPLIRPRKTTAPFLDISQSHKKVEKVKPMLSELVLVDSVLDKLGTVEWKKHVSGIMTPVLKCNSSRIFVALPTSTLPTGPKSKPCREMSKITFSDCKIFPNGQNKGLTVAEFVCHFSVNNLTHMRLLLKLAVWAGHEGWVCSQAQSQPPQQLGCFTSSLKISKISFCSWFPIKMHPNHSHQLRGQSWRVKQLAELHQTHSALWYHIPAQQSFGKCWGHFF